MRKNRIPKYSLHKATGQARVCIDGRDIYLGDYDSPKSHRRYREEIDQWQLRQRAGQRLNLTVAQLAILYDVHARQYYRKNGKPTSEVACIVSAMGPLLELFKADSANDFGPKKLTQVREWMIRLGWVRKTINDHIGRIRQMFRWAVSEELVGVEVYNSLMSISGLRRGRSKAAESDPVEPVFDLHVAIVLSLVPKPVAAMIKIQRATGMRPGEVIAMRPVDIQTDGDPWEYVPESHKTEHHSKARRVFIGETGKSVLRPFLELTEDGQRLFRPKHGGECYSTDSYRRSITRACKAAGIPIWSPNQLRHSFATEARRACGIENVRVLLGHSSAVTSEIYAERDFDAAREIARNLG